MKYLLDTHTFLWFINDAPELSIPAKTFIEDPENIIYLSIASLWEIAIKFSLGKLFIPPPFLEFISSQLDENNISLLEITPQHIGVVAGMPFHHRDPFDRLIIAQSLADNIPIIGKDAVFDAYAIQRYW